MSSSGNPGVQQYGAVTPGNIASWQANGLIKDGGGGGGGSGTVTSVSVTTANGVSGSVATATTTPAISLTLGAITPTSVAASGTVTGSNLSGTNTGDQTSVSGNAGTVTTINGRITAGTNITITGSGTAGSPYSIAASGSVGTGFDQISSATNTTAAMVVGSGATLAASGSGTITATAAPLSGITGLGTGVGTALGVNVGSAGAFVVNGGALGTPSSGTVTNLTGTAAINITGTAPAGTLTGTTLNSTVVTSSLTSVGSQAQALNMNSHLINNVTDPSSAQDAATKNYVDTALANLDSKPDVAYASTSPLPANTYANGSSGVGATLTGNSNGPLIIDSVTILVGQVGQRVLVAGESTSANNGWYTITQQGVVAVSPYILTRATESDQAAEIGAGYLTGVVAPNTVTPGTANNGKVFISVANDPFTVGTTSLTFSQVGGTYSAGTGLTLSGSTFSVNASQTQITGVGALAAGSLAAGFTAVTVPLGGTGGTSLTAYAPLFGGTTSTGAVQSGTVGTSGQVLTSNGAGALPTFQTAGGGSGTVTSVSAGAGTSFTTITASGSVATKSYVLAQSNVQASHTGDTTETTVVDYTLPANTLPANGTLRISTLWSRNSGGSGTVQPRIRFSTISGTIYSTYTAQSTTSLTLQGLNFIYANNATNAQKAFGGNGNSPYQTSTSAVITSAVDTTAAAHIVFTIQNSNSSDTGSLEAYIIELLQP